MESTTQTPMDIDLITQQANQENVPPTTQLPIINTTENTSLIPRTSYTLSDLSSSSRPPPRNPQSISIAVQSFPSSFSNHWGLPSTMSDTMAAQHYFLNRLVNRETQRHFLREESTIAERSVRPQFRSKIVCVIQCKHCKTVVCKRGMKAILLADMNVTYQNNLFKNNISTHTYTRIG